MSTQRRETIAGGFTETASDYEGAVRYNLEGAQRMVLSIPPGRYDDVLDVGCGSGWAAQAVIDRFHPARVTGVDPSEGMLEQFQAKVGSIEGVEVSLVQAGVEDISIAGVVRMTLRPLLQRPPVVGAVQVRPLARP